MFTPTVPAVPQLAAPLRQNIPALMGLLGVWNISFLDLNVRAVLPYSQVSTAALAWQTALLAGAAQYPRNSTTTRTRGSLVAGLSFPATRLLG